MNGTFFGAHPVVKVIFTKGSMNIKKSTISLRVMKLLEKIDSASISLECRRDLESSTLTLVQIHISSLTNLVNFMNIIKS
jgi:hypothetical protein